MDYQPPTDAHCVNDYQLLVAGSRDFTDRVLLYRKLDQITRIRKPRLVITGGAKGPDTFGHEWALDQGFETHVEFPDWKTYGRRAGFVRNEVMVKMLVPGDLVVVFYGPNGVTNGSKMTADLALAAGLALRTFTQPVEIPTVRTRYVEVPLD